MKIHEQTQVVPVKAGIPWLGFLVYPTHRLLKARKVHHFSPRLHGRWRDYCAGELSFAEFDATVKGWINHVRFGDTWGLRRHVLSKPLKRIREILMAS